jgi:hypothetical protein
MEWPLLMAVTGVVAITAIYFIWVRKLLVKPAAAPTTAQETPAKAPDAQS